MNSQRLQGTKHKIKALVKQTTHSQLPPVPESLKPSKPAYKTGDQICLSKLKSLIALRKTFLSSLCPILKLLRTAEVGSCSIPKAELLHGKECLASLPSLQAKLHKLLTHKAGKLPQSPAQKHLLASCDEFYLNLNKVLNTEICSENTPIFTCVKETVERGLGEDRLMVKQILNSEAKEGSNADQSTKASSTADTLGSVMNKEVLPNPGIKRKRSEIESDLFLTPYKPKRSKEMNEKAFMSVEVPLYHEGRSFATETIIEQPEPKTEVKAKCSITRMISKSTIYKWLLSGLKTLKLITPAVITPFLMKFWNCCTTTTPFTAENDHILSAILHKQNLNPGQLSSVAGKYIDVPELMMKYSSYVNLYLDKVKARNQGECTAATVKLVLVCIGSFLAFQSLLYLHKKVKNALKTTEEEEEKDDDFMVTREMEKSETQMDMQDDLDFGTLCIEDSQEVSPVEFHQTQYANDEENKENTMSEPYSFRSLRNRKAGQYSARPTNLNTEEVSSESDSEYTFKND